MSRYIKLRLQIRGILIFMENREELLKEISELKAQIAELIKENKSMKLSLIRVIEDLQESNINQRRMLANMRFLG